MCVDILRVSVSRFVIVIFGFFFSNQNMSMNASPSLQSHESIGIIYRQFFGLCFCFFPLFSFLSKVERFFFHSTFAPILKYKQKIKT